MKVLIVSSTDLGGGAGIAATRLHNGLIKIGINSRMLVQKKESQDPTIIGPRSNCEKYYSLIKSKINSLPPRLLSRDRNNFIFSASWFPNNTSKRIKKVGPDIVHLHWIGGNFVPIRELAKIKKPIIWTLHDFWAFTGGCHYPYDCTRYNDQCGNCPQLKLNNDNDLSRKIWRYKKKNWHGINLSLVTPSKWLAKCTAESSLFANKNIQVIPNGIDINIFQPINKDKARRILDLPVSKKFILFGTVCATTQKRKGFQFLQPALKNLKEISEKRLSDKIEILIFGSAKPKNPPDFGFPTHYLGNINDQSKLVAVYAASDVMVIPSIQDNLPNTIMEAISCGTPCVAFNVGGISDMIEHKKNGFLAAPEQERELARGVNFILADEIRWKELSANARSKTIAEFSLPEIAKKHTALYNKVYSQSLSL